jgi:hypothetical protein
MGINVVAYYLSIDFNIRLGRKYCTAFSESEITMRVVRLIKMCNKGRIGKYFSDGFPIQNCLNQGDVLSPLLLRFALEYAIRKSRKTRWD